MKFKTVKNVTLGQLKLEKGTPVFVRVEKEFFIGKDVKNSNKAPPLLAEVTNLETGEVLEMIVPTVLASTFTEGYDGTNYVGKCFRVEKLTNPDENGKRYSKFSLIEIELETK